MRKALFHLPGLFEFYDFYQVFLKLYKEHREYFFEWQEIASIYGAPEDCIWGGGRIGVGDNNAREVLSMLNEYGISGRLTFSNSLLQEQHLSDHKCNKLCALFAENGSNPNGIIVHSDLLVDYLRKNYPGLYLVSSTTKVQTQFDELRNEVNRKEFSYVVPDFRLNKRLEDLNMLSQEGKDKIEFLCNECCFIGCPDRKSCYENVSRQNLDDSVPDFVCKQPGGSEGYKFSKAMQSPAFISREDIEKIYLPSGFSNFKIEGRSLGSAILLEFILYYMVKPECQLLVRENIYLDSTLNLF